MAAIVVLAKAPVAGRVKTRLCPPCTPEEAARLAAAALEDTMDAVDAAQCERRVLVLDGPPAAWTRPGWTVRPQRDGGLGERLDRAFDDVDGPAILVGMDTPQLTGALLERGLRALDRADATLGLATDGGFWAIGFRTPVAGVFDGVPMSTGATGAEQHGRLRRLGLRTALLPTVRDVDDIDDARAVAAAAPSTRFAAVFASLGAGR